jgi:hypothetical protein
MTLITLDEMVTPITPEIVAAVIGRHFLYYKRGRDRDRRIYTGLNDRKCEPCKQMDYPLRRRFKLVPQNLEDALMEELSKLEKFQRALESQAEHYVKGGKIYTTLENLAAEAVHEWIKTQTRVKFGASRTRKYSDHEYNPFLSMMSNNVQEK